MTSRWVVVGLLAAVLLLPSLLVSALANQPVLRVDVIQGPGPEFSFSLAANRGPLPVHVGVIQSRGPSSGSRVLFVWYDPEYPLRYAAPGDVTGLESRVDAEAQLINPGLSVVLVDTATLLSDLNTHPTASVVFEGGAAVPDPLLAGAGTLSLRSWVLGGGTVYWAGGPFGFYDGSVGSNGSFISDSLGWSAQTSFFGFSLEDQLGYPGYGSKGPLYSNDTSAAGRAIGLSYRGTGDGANVSEVVKHNGTVLGYVSTPSPGSPEAARTSLAYIPLGAGGVYYFGGAIWANELGTVPEGSVDLCSDIALLAASGIRPDSGGAISQDVLLQGGSSTNLRLALPGDAAGAATIVSVEVAGQWLFCQILQFSIGPDDLRDHYSKLPDRGTKSSPVARKL